MDHHNAGNFGAQGGHRAMVKNDVGFGKTRWRIQRALVIGLLLVIPASPGLVSGTRAGIQDLDPGSKSEVTVSFPRFSQKF